MLKSFDNRLIISSFIYLDDLLKAVEKIKARGLEVKVYSPCPVPEIEEACASSWSRVRIFTFAGAVTGLVCGFALAILTSLDWPMRTSAKEIVSIPGFVVVGYEMTILFGGIFTLLGLFFLTKIPAFFKDLGYAEDFSGDRFGLVFKCNDEEAKEFINILRECHAEKVEVRDSF